LTATGGTSTSFLRKDNTWQTPTNTTYSEISDSEINTGTASTSRAMSGRRATTIVTRARDGRVPSTDGARLDAITDADYLNTNTTKANVGLGNVDNTSNATERAAAATLTNKTIDGNDNTLQDIGSESLQATIAFQATMSSTQTSPAATAVTVDFDTETYDIGSDFNTTTNQFTAPHTGIYNFQAYVSQPDSGTPAVLILLVVDSVTVYALFEGDMSIFRTAGGALDLLLTSGQTVEVQFYSSLADTIETNKSIFSGHLVGRTD
jgi:hypothetical protein